MSLQPFGRKRAISAYLTPFYRIILVLVVLWTLTGCQIQGPSPVSTTVKPATPRAVPSVTARFPAQNTRTPTLKPSSAARLTPTGQAPVTSSSPAAQITVRPSALAGVKLRFWYAWSGEAEKAVERAAADFNATNSWGIRVQVESLVTAGAMDDRVRSGVIQEDLPNLIAGYSSQLARWDGSGARLANLDPYLQDASWGLSVQEQADFFSALWNQDVLSDAGGSRRLGLPWDRSIRALIYNEGWARQLGFQAAPGSVESLESQVCAAAQANLDDQQGANDGSGGLLILDDPGFLVDWIYVFGGKLLDETAQRYRFATPEAIRALQYLRQLYESGCAWRGDGSSPVEIFAARRSLLYMNTLTSLADQQASLDAQADHDTWQAVPYPAVDGDPFVVAVGPSLGIIQTSPEADLASWLFLKWLLSPENLADLATVSGYLPPRAAAFPQMGEAPDGLNWQTAMTWMQNARVEPGSASWESVRWTLQDAAGQLFSPDFNQELVPELLASLEQVANEIDLQVR